MKKLLVVFAIIVSLNLSCEIRMCGCFNPPPLTFNLVIKNSMGEDLLSPSTAGNFAKEQIKLYKKEVDGSNTPLKFEINKPIPAGNTKVDYYQLVSPELVTFDRSNPNASYFANVAYIQFRDEAPYKIDLSYEQRNNKLNLSFAGFDVPKDEKILPYLNSLFYFTKKK